MNQKALVPFGSLPVGAWFVFPEQVDRLHEGDCTHLEPSYAGDPETLDRQLCFSVKTLPNSHTPSDYVHERNAYPVDADRLVLEVRRPKFIWFPDVFAVMLFLVFFVLQPCCAQTVLEYDRHGNHIGQQQVEGDRLVQRDLAGDPHGYWRREGDFRVHRNNQGNLLGRERLQQ